jgi:ribosome-associated protein
LGSAVCRGNGGAWRRLAPMVLALLGRRVARALSGGPPRRLVVDEAALSIKAVRSSGPGGQHVNKTSSCVEARFQVDTAEWLPDEVRRRLREQQAHRINKAGELLVSVQQERSQIVNRRIAVELIQSLVDEAALEPKGRDMWTGIGEEGKQRRKEEKRHRTQVKSVRRASKEDY